MEDKKSVFSETHQSEVLLLIQYLNSQGCSIHNVGHYLDFKIYALELNTGSVLSMPSMLSEDSSRRSPLQMGEGERNLTSRG